MVTLAKKYLAFALIFSLICGQVLRLPLDFLGLPGAGVVPSDLILILLGIVLFFQRPAILSAKLSKPIILFLAIGFIALVLNRTLTLPQFLASFFYLLRFGLLAGIYFIVREFGEKTKFQLQVGLIITGVSTAILGLVQYFLYPDLRNLAYMGWDEHLYRVFSTFLDPNFAGAFFVLVFVLVLGLNFGGFFSLPLLFLTMSALLLTYSRGAFLMFFISTGILLLMVNQKTKLILIFAFFILGIWPLPKNLPSEGVKLLRTTSVSARQETVQKALTIFRENPILGVGFNAYRAAQEKHGFLTVQDSHAAAGTDNSFLFVLATTGLVGFFAFIYLWVKILRLCYSSRSKLLAKVVFASVLGLFVNSFFVNSLFYESILVWLWVLIGIMEKR